MKSLISSLVILSMVASCGDPNDSAQIGFLTGAVSGIEYETATHAGTTDERGGFRYEEGELVTFRIGSTVLGETGGQKQVTPFDLAGIEVITDGRRGIQRSEQRFNRVVNLLVLLHTFDRDLDPSNGIEITEDVAALFEDVEVRLDGKYSRFRRNRDFRRALNRANAAALLTGHGVVADPVAALTDLYETLEVTPGFFEADSEEIDSDGDGYLDEVLTFRYDTRGHPVLQTRHRAGSPFVVTELEFGPAARPLLIVKDIHADGVADAIDRTVLNRDGEPIRSTTDRDADGTIESVTEQSYSEYGELVSSISDRDGDGRADEVTRWVYADAGDWEERSDDNDGDGMIDRITRTYFDFMGREERVEDDTDADGVIDSIKTTRYDAAGNEVETTRDDDADGVPNLVTAAQYDLDGKKIRETNDLNGDGEAESVASFIYDEDGNLVLTETDWNMDGTVDEFTIYTYDDRGNCTRTRIDHDGDGTIDYQSFSEFDENGFAVFTSNDDDGDGIPEYVKTSTGVPVGWARYFWD